MVDSSKPQDQPGTATPAGPSQERLPQDFETALAQLEALVARMESGEMALDESLAAYERGVELTRICQRRLEQAEQQVKVLQGNLLKPLDDVQDCDED